MADGCLSRQAVCCDGFSADINRTIETVDKRKESMISHFDFMKNYNGNENPQALAWRIYDHKINPEKTPPPSESYNAIIWKDIGALKIKCYVETSSLILQTLTPDISTFHLFIA